MQRSEQLKLSARYGLPSETAKPEGQARSIVFAHEAVVDLTIIIVNYNTTSEVIECLNSIEANHANLTVDAIVVDNASSDYSMDDLRKMFPTIRVIDSGRNGGFSFANNIGLRHARGRHLLLLNPDTCVSVGVLQAIVAKLEHEPSLGVIGVAQETYGGRLEGSALRIIRPWHLFARAFLPVRWLRRISDRLDLRYENAPVNAEYDCEALVGCFLAMRREIVETVGGLEQRIFMYGEELEFCWRVSEAGFRNRYFGTYYIEHRHGASTRNLSIWRDVQMQAGQLLSIRFTQGMFAARSAALAMTLSHLLRAPIELIAFGARWKPRLKSRMARLRRSISAIFVVPDCSRQQIN